MLRLEPVPRFLAWAEARGLQRERFERKERHFETIRTFWIGDNLPTFHRMCLQSWLDIPYEVELYAYGPVDNVPRGVRICDATEIMPRSALFEDAPSLERRPFTRANIFRMALLANDRGPWCDADYLMFRSLPPVRDILVGREHNGHLCNAILWAPPDFEMMERVLASFKSKSLENWAWWPSVTAVIKSRLASRSIEHADFPKHHWGRHAVTYFVAKHGLQAQVQDHEAFYYPVIYDDTMYKSSNKFEHIVENVKVRGLHFFFKTEAHVVGAEKGSFIDWAKQKFLRY